MLAPGDRKRSDEENMTSAGAWSAWQQYPIKMTLLWFNNHLGLSVHPSFTSCISFFIHPSTRHLLVPFLLDIPILPSQYTRSIIKLAHFKWKMLSSFSKHSLLLPPLSETISLPRLFSTVQTQMTILMISPPRSCSVNKHKQLILPLLFSNSTCSLILIRD